MQKDDDSEDESEDEDIENDKKPTVNGNKRIDGFNVDQNMLKQIIQKESPELNKILEEFILNVDTLNNKLKPVLKKVYDQKSGIETKHGMTYLEMKYNLLCSYCQFLSLYLLLKLEG